jgi:hypothetical protein
MDKITQLENLLSQRLLNGDVDYFINEIKMMGLKSTEAETMDPFGDPDIGSGVARVLADLEANKSYSDDINQLYKKLKTSTKMFSAIGLDGYSQTQNVDLKDPKVEDTIEKALMTPFNREELDKMNLDSKVMNPVNVKERSFSIGDTVIVDGDIKLEGTHKIVGKIGDNQLVLDSGVTVNNPDILKKVEGDISIIKPPVVKEGMNGSVEGIGQPKPSTEGNNGTTIDQGVNMSEHNFGEKAKIAGKSVGGYVAGSLGAKGLGTLGSALALKGGTAAGLSALAGSINPVGAAVGAGLAAKGIYDYNNNPDVIRARASKTIDKAAAKGDLYAAKRELNKVKALGKAGVLGDDRKSGLLGIFGKGKTNEEKYLDKLQKREAKKRDWKFEKKYGKLRNNYWKSKIEGIGDLANTISGAAASTLPNVARAITETANATKNAKNAVAPNLTYDQVKKMIEENKAKHPEAVNASMHEVFSEIEKYFSVDLNSDLHKDFIQLADDMQNYSEILADPDTYYMLFSGDEIEVGDVIDFSEAEVLVTNTLNNGETSTLNGINLTTGENVMFNVSNHELYESTDCFNFDEGEFLSDSDVVAPVASDANFSGEGQYVVVIDKVAKDVKINGPMSSEDAEKLYIQSAGTPDMTVIKANSDFEAGKLADDAKKSFVKGSLENAGIKVKKDEDVVDAVDVSVGDVTKVTTAEGVDQVLIDDKKPGVGDSMTFSCTVIDSDNLDRIGNEFEFNVPSDTQFSIDDFYMEDEGCFFSDLDETSNENNNDIQFSNETENGDNKMDEVMVFDSAAEVRFSELKEGDVTDIVDNEGNFSEVLVNETRSDGEGNTVVEATVLSSNLFSEGEVFMFSAGDNEVTSVVANAYNNLEGLNFSDSEYWLVTENRSNGSRQKLGPYSKAELESTFDGLQEAGHKVWRFKSEGDADAKVAGKMTTAQKVALGAGIGGGALATAAGLVALDRVKNGAKVTDKIPGIRALPKAHCGNCFSASDLMVGDIVEAVFNETPTQVMITDGNVYEDHIDFSAITLDSNIAEKGTSVTFQSPLDAQFSYFDTYDAENDALFSEMELENGEEANFAEEGEIADKLEQIKAEGNVAKTVDEVKAGDVAKVGDAEVVITSVDPSEGGAKVSGTVVEDKSAEFSAGDEVDFEVASDYIFSISDIYDFESQTFFSEAYENNFAMDATPTEAPTVEVIEKTGAQAETSTAPVDPAGDPVTRKLGEPAGAVSTPAENEIKKAEGANFSEHSQDSLMDKMNYLMSK